MKKLTTRYSGDLTITLTYFDPPKGADPNGSYRATLSWPARSRARGGSHRHTLFVNAPSHLRHAVDSPEAYDEAAHAAISFGSEEEPEIGEHASPDRNGSGWHIGRMEKRAWPIPIDDRTYKIVGINGYQSRPMTLEQAHVEADRMREVMKRAGWAGKVRIYDRDGSEVK